MSAIADPVLLSRDALPVCLGRENSNRLVSLLDVLRFHAEHFCRASSLLGQIYMDIKSGKSPENQSWAVVAAELGLLDKLCEELHLPVTLSQLRRVKQLWFDDHGRCGLEYLGQQLIEIQTRLNDELAARMVFIIKAGNADYLGAFTPGSGITNPTELERAWAPVFVAFPSVKYDAIEALRAYGVGRNTASVFHLMRVLEIGLSVLGSLFGVSLAHTNWAPAIEQIESNIREMHKDPAWRVMPDCKEQQEFYAQAASHFGILKDAWRNYTAHARGKYDEQEADDVMTGVRAFMQKLAMRLHE